MKILRHFTANDMKAKPLEFAMELAMEAYLIENEQVLALDDDKNETFGSVEVIDAELPLKGEGSDGRLDILATYSREYIAIVELKLDKLILQHLEQLKGYLKVKEKVLEKHPVHEILDEKEPKWIGVLVGTAIDPSLESEILNIKQDIPIAALTIQRFRGKDGSIYVTTDTYFNNSYKDRTKYKFNGVVLAKNRLVLAIIKQHVEKNPNITFGELENVFPVKDCRHDHQTILCTKERFDEEFSHKKNNRHFSKVDELITLKDSTQIVVWNGREKKTIETFKIFDLELGYKIDIENHT